LILKLILHTIHATVFLYDDVMFNSAGSVNPQTPYLFIQYLGYVEVARNQALSAAEDAQDAAEEARQAYESMMNNPTISVDSSSGTPSAEITAEGSEPNKHYHFSFHNLKGHDGSGFFSFAIENGYLYVWQDEDLSGLNFEFDSTTGNLYVVQEA